MLTSRVFSREVVLPYEATHGTHNAAFPPREHSSLPSSKQARIPVNGPISSEVPDHHATASFPKVSRLLDILRESTSPSISLRCLIFVQNRAVGQMLLISLRDTYSDGRVKIALIPGGTWSSDAENMIQNFSGGPGRLNVLLVPEDVQDALLPKATLVIRFDVQDNQLSCVWARLCLEPHGTLIHLVEAGNDEHRRTLARSAQCTDRITSWTAMLREGLDVPNPPPELRVSWKGRISHSAPQQPYVKNPVSNGVIRSQDATHVVLWLASTFRRADEQPLLRHVDASGRHMYSVHLPGTLTEAVRGDVCDTLTEARRSACMRACQAICSRGMLDPCFYRTVGTDGEHQAGALLAANKYHVKSVFFWENCLAIPGARRWYPTLLRSEEEGTASMLMLTAQPLPPLMPLKLYPAGQAVQIQLIRGSPFELSEYQVHMLHRYTLRVHRMIVNKRLVCQLERTPYFLAPYSGASAPLNGEDLWPTLGEHIPWKAVEQTATTWTTPLTLDDLARDVNDLVVQDRSLEFTKRYFISRLRPDLNPTSKPAEGSREAEFPSYLECARARSKRFDHITDLQQPLLEIESAPTAFGVLNPCPPASVESSKAETKYLIPQLCSKVSISRRTYRAIFQVPSIIYHIERQLLAAEVNASILDHNIHDGLLQCSLTSRAALMDVDYERLEFFGDAYLKYCSSVDVFLIAPTASENQLHSSRMHVISNKTLQSCAQRTGLPRYIHTKPFAQKSWLPPNFSVVPDPPKFSDDTDEQAPALDGIEGDLARSKAATDKAAASAMKADVRHIEDKVIADVAEAILGAAYLSGGDEVARRALKTLNLPLPHLDRWKDMTHRLYTATNASTSIRLRPGTITAIEEILDYRFKHPHLLAQALTFGHYEQLEFLGDAVLELLVVRHLYKKHENLPPGALSLLKNAMTANTTLAAICIESGLYRHMHAGPPTVTSAVTGYAARLDVARRQEQVRLAQEGQQPGQFWVNLDEPKVLSDVLEAVLGAAFASGGCVLESVEPLFKRMMKPVYDRHIALGTLASHPTKVMCELLESHGCNQFSLEKRAAPIRHETICDVMVHGVVVASSQANTAAGAARRASAQAVAILEREPARFAQVCDCRSRVNTQKAQRKALRAMLRGFVENDAELEKMLPTGR